MNKFKNYRALTTRVGFVVVVIVALLVGPSFSPVQGRQDDPQCEFLKQKITAPRDNKEKNSRNYYCTEMQRRNCSDYKALCEDSTESSSESPVLGKWTGKYKNSKGEGGDASITFESGANGKITGNEDGVPLEAIKVEGNVVTFNYTLSGCREVEGRFVIAANGKTATGSYGVTECDKTTKYTGNYLLYEKVKKK